MLWNTKPTPNDTKAPKFSNSNETSCVVLWALKEIGPSKYGRMDCSRSDIMIAVVLKLLGVRCRRLVVSLFRTD